MKRAIAAKKRAAYIQVVVRNIRTDEATNDLEHIVDRMGNVNVGLAESSPTSRIDDLRRFGIYRGRTHPHARGAHRCIAAACSFLFAEELVSVFGAGAGWINRSTRTAMSDPRRGSTDTEPVAALV